jgi:hypothetical protein
MWSLSASSLLVGAQKLLSFVPQYQAAIWPGRIDRDRVPLAAEEQSKSRPNV